MQAATCTNIHKPATVSGGGKSEIAKPIDDYVTSTPIVVLDINKDLDTVESIINYTGYETRWTSQQSKDSDAMSKIHAHLLAPEYSLGDLIKLLTISPNYIHDYNAYVDAIPQHIRSLLFTVKKFYLHRSDQFPLDGWRSMCTVDTLNGKPGYHFKFNGEPQYGMYCINYKMLLLIILINF